MALLAGKLYDPATVVNKSLTGPGLAMTAFDTTNLRLTFTAPANGTVLVRIACTITGAATFPAILLGVLSGATVMGRIQPLGAPSGTALATTYMPVDTSFLVTGLTAASAQTWDAAYGVEFGVTNAVIRYGGPNNTTISDAGGGLAFEVWSTA